MTEVATQVGFDTGRVVRRALDVLRGNLTTFLLLSVLLAGLPSLGFGYLSTRIGPAIGDNIDPDSWGWWGAGLVATLFCAMLLNAAMTHGALKHLNGQRATFLESLAEGLNHLPMLVPIGLLSGLGITFGYALLIIPGVMLSVAWAVIIPVRVAERTGVLETMARSRELTRDMRGPIFGLMAVYVIAKGLLSWLVSTAATGLGQAEIPLVLDTLIETVGGLIASVGLVSIYCELRWSKEGTAVENLASVFD